MKKSGNKEEGVLTPLFWKIAKDTKKRWNQLAFTDYALDLDLDYEQSHICLTSCNTHCGTLEFQCVEAGDEYQGGTLENIVCLISNNARHQSCGHFVYYAPHSPEYDESVKKLVSLGFKELYKFRHYGYVERDPDYGWASVYSLALNKTDMKLFKKLAPRVSTRRKANDLFSARW